MQYVEDQARNAGIVVPFINNDAWWGGKNAPGTGKGEVNIVSHPYTAIVYADFPNDDSVRTRWLFLIRLCCKSYFLLPYILR